MSFGQNFPVSDYYKDHILDAVTLSRTGTWWSAILLIQDPRPGNPFISFYKWQSTDLGWKRRQNFICRRTANAEEILKVVREFLDRLQ